MNIKVSEYQSRSKPNGRVVETTWNAFADHARHPIITEETLAEYAAMSDAARTNAKDVGGYVGGETVNGYRSKDTVINRCIVSIDADDASFDDIDNFRALNTYTFICHTTHSSTDEKPRFRWMFPLTRPVNNTEYNILIDVMKHWVGADTIDRRSYLPEQLMFWPSCCSDAHYQYWEDNYGWINPDDILDSLTDEEKAEHSKEPSVDISEFIGEDGLSIPEGSRNNTVFYAACQIRRTGVDDGMLMSIMTDYNEKYVNPPLPSRELKALVRNVCKTVKPGDPVPMEERDYLDDIAEYHEKEKPKSKKIVGESLSDIMDRDIPEPPFLIPGLVPSGLTILAAEPKMGKSWMALDMAMSVASGTDFLGLPTNRAGVLYLALEDNDYRLKNRGCKVANGRKIPADLHVATEAPTLPEGLVPLIDNYIDNECPTAKMVIIDTLQCVRGVANKNEGVYGFDYKELTPVHQYALDKGIAVVILHHTNKGKIDGSVWEKINGSQGLTGSCDSMIVLVREKQKSKEVKMNITGRDLEGKTYVVRFNNLTYRWENLGEEDDFEDAEEDRAFDEDPVVKTIVRHLDKAENESTDLFDDVVTWTCTSGELLSEVSRDYETEYTSASSLGMHINKIAFQLEEKLGITHSQIRDKNKREHCFTRPLA